MPFLLFRVIFFGKWYSSCLYLYTDKTDTVFPDWALTRPFLLASIIPYTPSLSIVPHRLPFLSSLSQMPHKKSAKQKSKRKKAHVFIFVHIHSLPIGGLILYFHLAVSAQYILYYTILFYYLNCLFLSVYLNITLITSRILHAQRTRG
jgi:hypothetical protein